MALDALLENEARAEIERVRAEGRERAQAILREAQERAQALVESRTRALETQRQAELTRARSAADLELAAARLNANESGLAQAFDIAQQELRNVTQVPEYREILARLISEARQAIPDAEALEVNPAEAHIAREVAPGIDVRENPAIRGGVRVVGRGGKSGISNTLEGRLERVRAALSPQIARMMAE
ncbi:V-type ATP synthase subunit E [Deinococcus maricopensis]|uniref:V-type proton ATPase subunit E n=1 Tax=Deinococcus maricopensis (strain DSM 21211 / LMG 22137 / NRRL B-23946 / LB-34) TaxID=709986 RepID=E8UBF0_DEIML|nr:V-type ATP synthase subunit E [Deinococcus maricopensis]ADV68389.1 V-type proton ATPase subunit E [Deinococcus maricopensis DSM 21211]